MRTTRAFEPGDRYRYDFELLTYDKGWAQFDTRQDASYYGTWINPAERKVFCYCEGDTTLVECDDAAEFRKYVDGLVEWSEGRIDPGFGTEMADAFRALGMERHLH